MKRTSLLLLTCLSACTTETLEPPSQSSVEAPANVVTEFYGEVKDGVMTITSSHQSVRGLLPANVVQDGAPGSGPPESIELFTANVATGIPTCPDINSHCGDVTIRSFYGEKLSNVWIEIYAMVPATGYEAINGDPDTSGGNLSELYGLWNYGDIPAGGSSTRQWAFLYLGGDFKFRGRVMATGSALEFKLTASDAAVGDAFGQSVSISGNTAVVGAPSVGVSAGNACSTPPFQSCGAAYVFSKMGSSWGQIARLAVNDVNGSTFGRSVSISGDVAVVGASSDHGWTGSAFLFYRNEGGADAWGLVARIEAADGTSHDHFGESVSISGDLVVIGAIYDDQSGSAYIFYRNHGGPDAWGQVAKLTASDAMQDDDFGISVSVSGDTAVVGAWRDDDSLTNINENIGSAYVFSRDHGGTDAWGQVAKVTASDRVAGDYFGRSVSISGDNVVVGAHKKSLGPAWPFWLEGAAYVFSRNQGGTNAWGQVAKLTASDASRADFFGSSVSISGDVVLVGEVGCGGGHVTPCVDTGGSAYVFSRNQSGPDSWGEVVKLTASDADVDDAFGNSVSVSGDVFAIGAYHDDDAGSNSGSAYIK